MKKHVKKGKGKEKTISPTSSKNKIFTVSYKEKWIHNRRFDGHQHHGSIQNNTINPLNTKGRLLYLKTQSIPRSKHFHLGYKNQSVYTVSGTSRCLSSDKYSRPLYLKTQFVPRSKHFSSVIKTNQFIL